MKKFFVLFTILLLVKNSSAQETYKFLNLDYSPRAAALAGSFVSNTDASDVIFYNPAGIGLLEEKPISFSYVSHLLDINSASVSYSQEIENIGRFAAGIVYTNYGDFIEANEFGVQTGNFGAGELAAIIGYSNELDENFYYGVNLKYIFSSIADRNSMGLAADIGLMYTIPDQRLNFGFSALNMGAQITQYYSTSEKLPLDVRFGFSKTLEHLPFTFYASLNRLNADADSFGDRVNRFTVGGEFKMSKVIRLRFGYDNAKRKELKVGGTAGIAGFNLGVGIVVSQYNFDYSFSSLGDVGALHRIGLSTNL